MAETNNLADLIEKRLPAEIVEFMQEAALLAAGQGHNLYLVGGVVRDILLERTNLDLDLSSTGNAIDLAQKLTAIRPGRLTTHIRFQTATIAFEKWSVDIATVRSEIYARPGALPTVLPGSIRDDLFRRDFTINAMAIELAPGRWGELVDPYGGQDDLDSGVVRILHPDSFIDDATRIWRAMRFEQRLGFKLEPKTLRLVKRDIPMLDTISIDRIRHELELALREERPENVLRRADRLGALQRLHPALEGDAWLAAKFERAREISAPDAPPAELYLALLVYRLTEEQTAQLILSLGLRKAEAQVLAEVAHLKASFEELDDPGLKPSRIYSILQPAGTAALNSGDIASESPVVQGHIALFLTRLRDVKPVLTGSDLKKLGIAPGPQMKELLQRLLDARLDAEVRDRRGEVKLVEGWVRRLH